MTQYEHPRRSWLKKFADAFHGLALGISGQSSFFVHLPCAALVVVAGIWLRVDRYQWCLLALCIAIVLAAEMFNSALERLAKAIDNRENEHLAAGLNIASAAVLVAAFGAVAVGMLIFVPRLLEQFAMGNVAVQ